MHDVTMPGESFTRFDDLSWFKRILVHVRFILGESLMPKYRYGMHLSCLLLSLMSGVRENVEECHRILWAFCPSRFYSFPLCGDIGRRCRISEVFFVSNFGAK